MIAQHDNIVGVGMPEGAHDVGIYPPNEWDFDKRRRGLAYSIHTDDMDHRLPLPPGKWKLIGLHSKEKPLTEEEWAEVVTATHYKRFLSNEIERTVYKNYLNDRLDSNFRAATESGLSLLNKLGLYIENPKPL